MILPYINDDEVSWCLIHSFGYAYSLYKVHCLPDHLSVYEFECLLSESNIIIIERFELAYHKQDDKPYFWIGNTLYIKGKFYAKLIEHENYKDMFYIQWNKRNKISNDFYNLSRAKDHCLNYAIKDRLI
jgi:hypothetical protein